MIEFAELLRASIPWEDGTLVMLRAYVDASHRPHSGIFCVGGVAFGLDRAIAAEKEWRALFGDRVCHMADLNGRKDAFEDVGDVEADRLCRGAIGIINTYASHVVSISCDIDQVLPALPTATSKDGAWLLDAAKGVYPCCLHWALGAFGDLMGHQKQGVSYLIEQGDLYSGSAAVFLDKVNGHEGGPLRDHYAYGSAFFAPKESVRLLECADVVAWEWAYHVERMRSGRPIRRSLAALMEDDDCLVGDRPFVRHVGRYANHYSGWPVDRYMRKWGQVMLASSVDELRQIDSEDAPLAQSPSGRA